MIICKAMAIRIQKRYITNQSLQTKSLKGPDWVIIPQSDHKFMRNQFTETHFLQTVSKYLCDCSE